MIRKYKTALRLTNASVFSIILAANLNAQDIDWSRVDGATNTSELSFTSATSGSFELDKPVYLFHSAQPGGFYDAPDGPETNINFPGAYRMYAGGSISSSYTFNHVFSDAKLPIFNAWQSNDYKVEVFGGDAVISGTEVTFGNVNNNDLGLEGSDYNIIGEGTSSIILDAKDGPTEGANSFYGSLQVTGSFSGIKFTQMFDEDRAQALGDDPPSTSIDSLTRTRITGISGATIAPEPSSTLLLMLSGVFLFRRNRQ